MTYCYKFINHTQTKEERQAKYLYCLAHGITRAWAMAMRDWRFTKIERALNSWSRAND